MRWVQWTGIISAGILVVSFFFPWVIIESKNIAVSGIDATGIRLGKPAYFHFLFIFFFLVFTFTPRIWAKRMNLLVVALNVAWAVRNYFLVTACHAGECPVKQWAVYLLIPLALLMLMAALFPDIKLKEPEHSR
jgi:hypothetical protein